MADDNTLRSYRSNDPYRRNAQPAEPQDPAFGGSDPLAELARLIGQSDPYNDKRRQPQGADPRAVQRDEPDTGDWRRHIQRQRPSYDDLREQARYEDLREQAPVDLDARSRYGAADPRASDPRYAPAEQHARYADHDPYRMPSGHYDDHYGDPRADDQYDPHADYRHDPRADHLHDRSYAAAAANDYPDERMYAAPPRQRGHAGDHDHGGYAAHDQSGFAAHADEDYDDPPRRGKSGSGLVTAVILIGCAMLGTAGAYGYRTYASGSGSKQAPVIIADNAPNKIVPTEQKSSRSQDRVATQGNDERLVSREEQPVSLQPPGNSAVPHVSFPSPVQPAPNTTGSTPQPNAQGTAPDQPRRVRTVPIRPEGGDGSSRPTSESRAEPAPPPAARSAPPQQQTRRDQPMSLDPNDQTSEPARPQQPGPRVAALPPAGGAAGATGGYLVQVSSQRSEADAQSSYRALQAKYAQLKSRQAIIRRADLGDKGVYYRAMIGPFESGDQAAQFCNGLKQSGGQCIIHRN